MKLLFLAIVGTNFLFSLSPAAKDVTKPLAAIYLTDQFCAPKFSQKENYLTCSLRVHNNLTVAISRVHIGMLVTEKSKTLEQINPAILYNHLANNDEQNKMIKNLSIDSNEISFAVIKQTLQVTIEAESDVLIEFIVKQMQNELKPAAYVMHVLSFEFANISVPLLLKLLESQAVADEIAAIQAFGLQGTAKVRLKARHHWAEISDQLLPEFIAQLRNEISARPSESETFRWIFAIRALGVLGGSSAEQVLRDLLRIKELDRFDEPLQVLRIAKVRGNLYNAPLAFMLNSNTKRMIDIVAVGLSDCLSLENEGADNNKILSKGDNNSTNALVNKTESYVKILIGILVSLLVGVFIGLRLL
ncbi:MAG: hypothetical protein JW841_14775 [Deltaproteobacteria bacterium]|nr:hypothetical protein [Deltaproteobacteria bacterium]